MYKQVYLSVALSALLGLSATPAFSASSGNHVVINADTTDIVHAGITESGDANGNTLIINGGKHADGINIMGGSSSLGTSDNNTVRFTSALDLSKVM